MVKSTVTYKNNNYNFAYYSLFSEIVSRGFIFSYTEAASAHCHSVHNYSPFLPNIILATNGHREGGVVLFETVESNDDY